MRELLPLAIPLALTLGAVAAINAQTSNPMPRPSSNAA